MTRISLAVLAMIGGAAALIAAAPELSVSVPVTHRFFAETEGLAASDVTLTQNRLTYGQARPEVEWAASVALGTYGVDYAPAPFDFLGQATRLETTRTSGQIEGRFRVGENGTVLASGGAYHGFTDYRSLWLDEYYRQQFSPLPGYVEADPRGENGTAGFRWEYLPASGYFQADVSFLHDAIAPGYEIDFTGLSRGREDLASVVYHFGTENILTRRIRIQNDIRLTDTTDRELRFAYLGGINVALSERWVLRANIGFTQEEPTFRAVFSGLTLEVEPVNGWLIGLSGRYYTDTGEIQNALFSAAAPGVDAWQIGLGVRHVWGRHSLKVFAAPYFTRYEPFGIGTAFFQNLYKSRDWGLLQIAYAGEF
jgi:hypothetical protein